jgi:hypothetical protein
LPANPESGYFFSLKRPPTFDESAAPKLNGSFELYVFFESSAFSISGS